LAVPIAALAGIVLALPLGAAMLRLKGPYFAIGMFGLARVLESFVLGFDSITQGGTGLYLKPLGDLRPVYFVLVAIALVMALVAGAAERLGGPGTAARANLPSHSDFNGIASIVLFVFAAVVAPELLCRDRREGTLNLYLVRPLTGSDYVVSRWAAFLSVLTAAAWLPQLVLWLGLSMGDPAPLEYVRAHWLDVPRFLGAGLVMAAYTTTIALLTASFTTRRAYASVFLVGLFAITTPFTAGLAQEIEGAAGQWISMFNLTNIPLHVSDVIFGKVSEVTEDAPARALGARTLVAWCALWTVGPALVLWSRYRRMSP
jgi:ABC-type transport system involved in multi-copper enzyme maturation permease subunit